MTALETEDEGDVGVSAATAASGWSSTNTSVNKGTANHIDIGVTATATLEVYNATAGQYETLTQSVSLTNDDFNSTGAVTLTATWKDEAFDEFTFNTGLSTSTYTGVTPSIQQIRVSGSYPVGTIDYPVVYSLTLTKDVTFTDSSGNTYTVTMSFTDSFSYWQEDNMCDGLTGGSGQGPGQGPSQSQGSSWEDGGFIQGSGLDFILTATASASSITIYKYVYDMDGNLLTDSTTGANSEVSTQTYTFKVYNSSGTVVKTITLSPSSNGMASTTFELNTTSSASYYVVETTPTAAIGNYDYDSTSTSAYEVDYSSGTGTAGTAQTTDTTKSATIEVDSDSSATYYFYNYYGDDTISVTADKVWDDDDDVYGLRPSSITYTLKRSGSTYDTQTVSVASDGSASYTWEDLPISTDGTTNVWTVEETAVSGYTTTYNSSTDSDGNITYTVTNTLNVGRLAIAKTVNGDVDTNGMTFTFTVSGFDSDVESVYDTSGNSYTVSGGVATVTVAAGSTVTLVNVPVGSYTVTETGSNTTYTWITTGEGDYDVTAGSTTTAEIENTVQYTGTINLTKIWDDESNKYDSRPAYILVTLTGTGSDGKTYFYSARISAEDTTASAQLTGVEFYDTNGVPITYEVAETMHYSDGTSYTSVYTYTETYSVDTNAYTPATDGRNVTITNALETTTVTVNKTVLDADGNPVTDNTDEFRFVLYMYDENNEAVQIGSATTIKNGETATFTGVPVGATVYLTEVLVSSHVHSYDTTVYVNGTEATVTESFGYVSSVDADAKTHTVSFTVSGTGSTVTVNVTNQEEEVSVDLSALVNGSKTLNVTEALEEDLTFTYSVYEGQTGTNTLVATGTTTFASGTSTQSTEDITWTYINTDAFTYTEVGTYTYTIMENVTSSGGVVYDSTRYTLTIKVTQDTDGGGLLATASMTKNAELNDGSGNRETTDVTSDTDGETSIVVAKAGASSTPVSNDTFTASFTNTYDPSETSVILRAVKTLTGGTLEEKQFSVTVQEYSDADYTTPTGDGIVRENGANGYMGYEIVYDEEDAGFNDSTCWDSTTNTFSKTYYYTVTENIPTTANSSNNYTVDGVTYTTVTYYVKVTVSVKATYDGTGYEQDGDVYISEAVYSTDKTNWNDLYETTTVNGEAVTTAAILDFTNEYNATGEATLSTYKVMQNRSFVNGETFTFTITDVGGNAPALTAASGVTDFVDNGDGTYTVTVTVSDSTFEKYTDSSGNTYYVLKFNLADVAVDQDDLGTYNYRINETGASNSNGVTLDSGEYGRLITLTVTDNRDGTLTAATSSTNDVDWNQDNKTDSTAAVIVNTFNPGSVTLYGTKTWVDGSTTHTAATNEAKITLTVSSSTDYDGDVDTATWIPVDSSDYEIYWYDNGDWHISGLPQYDDTGKTIYYMIVEETISGYTTTYSSDVYTGEGYTDTTRFTITNTIEQEEMTLSGTKTWIEPTTTSHTNEDEITLNVSRRSETMASAEDLTQATGNGSFDGNGDPVDGTYIVVWTDKDSDGYAETYNIYWYYTDETGYVGLPVYDSAGYDYRYTVTETITDTEKESTYEKTTTWSVDETDSTIVTFNFTNRAPDEPPVTPEKSVDTDGDEVYDDDGEKVSVGDLITYSISYTNNTNDVVTVTITDVLDDGLTYKDSSHSCSVAGESTGTNSSGTTFNYGGTITWTIANVQPFTSGYVTVTVEVNENARTLVGTEKTATVDNTASVQIGDNPSVDTNPVTTELEDDPEEEPEKTLAAVYANNEAKTDTTYVSVGDVLCYTISYKNHYNATSTITITDVLDTGVDFYFGSNNAKYDDTTRTVTWSLTALAYEEGYVYLYVVVNEDAKATTNDYDVQGDGTLTYGTGTGTYATTASVANEAAVAVADNEATYTNVVDTPLEPDDPTKPEKTEVTIGGIETSDPTIDGTTYKYGSVDVGSVIEYRISYYNNNNTAATVTITDTLDDGVELVLSSVSSVTYSYSSLTGVYTWTEDDRTITYNENSRIIKWVITGVTALTEGYVEFEVEVTKDAIDGANTVENTATVSIDNDSATTNTVENDVDDEPADPTKTVSTASEAGKDNAAVSVGDKITYIISYYNYNSTTADIVITDELEDGLTYYYATDDGAVANQSTGTDSNGDSFYYGGTVTWTIPNVAAYGTGTVELTVIVNENAEVKWTVENTASVTVGNDPAYTSNTNTNDVDDDPEDPTKSVEIGDADATDDNGEEVSVGDTLTYTISYYQNLASAANVTITDTLDEGVTLELNSLGTYTHSGNVYTWTGTDADGIAYTITYNASYRTLTWVLESVPARTHGSVNFDVTVNENAKTLDAANDDTASVVNTGRVAIGNNPAVTTNEVENPLTPDDPTKPVKTVEIGDADTTDDNGEEVSVGQYITYTIEYYNNLATTATVTITDELDNGVTYYSSSPEGTVTGQSSARDSSGTELYKYGGAVTWTIENVAPFTTGYVTLTVLVNDNARNMDDANDEQATVYNEATAKVGNQNEQTSEPVENPLEPDDPEDPTKTVTKIGDDTASSVSTAADGTITYEDVGVGDIITYSINYYNNYNAIATVTIEDELDDGVTYVSGSATGTQKTATLTAPTAETPVVYELTTEEIDNGDGTTTTRVTKITWTLLVNPLTDGTVSFQVQVNNDAKTIDAATEDTATVENEATVTTDQEDPENEHKTNIVVNPIDPDKPTDPTKTISSSSAGSTEDPIVQVGDEITYIIGYTNNNNTKATVTITDKLDEGVDFVSLTDGDTVMTAADSDVYSSTDHTVTYTIENVVPYGTGYVTLTVKVNDKAIADDTKTVENTAGVQIGNEEAVDTETVTTPVDDEPENPEKTISSITYADTTDEDTLDDNENTYVHVGDQVTYTVSYYNNLHETANVIVTDVLDKDVKLISADGDTTVDTTKAASLDNGGEANYVTYTTSTDADGITTVTWTIYNVEAFGRGTVNLTVEVLETATDSANTYSVNGDYELTYGVGDDTTASIANQTGTTVVSARITNQSTCYSVPVENPLEEEEPETPTKTEETVEEETVDPTVTTDADGTETHEYGSVGVGETVTYTIEFYNHHNTAATITVVDPLDEGLTILEDTITDGGVYDADAHTITWTLNVEPLTGGTVSFQAMVNENAKTISTATETVAIVDNQAVVTNSEDTGTDNEYKTNIVVNPIDPDDPSDPQKFVSSTSEAGVDGDNVSVGDQITYAITYYNHTNTVADVTIKDDLIDGVTYVDGSATDGGVYDATTHTVNWTIKDVAPYTGGVVYLTVEVTEDALIVTQVENDAVVTIGGDPYTTNLVVHPVDDDPQDPVKSVDVGDGSTVSTGDKLTYTIEYYNNLGTSATVTITDELDSDVKYVSSSNGGVYDSDTHTVTWTIEDVSAYTTGTVTLKVKVKSGATGTITNIANVQIADGETQETVSTTDTNEVSNTISTSSSSSKSSSPKTGDSFWLMLWVLLLAGSAAGLLALYFRRKNSDDAE